MNKVVSLDDAMQHIKDGASIMVGGFLGVGTAEPIIDEIVKRGIKNLTVYCNDSGFSGVGVGKLLDHHLVKKIYASYVGGQPETMAQMTTGELEVVLVPQGTLAEQVRAGGLGLGGILTATGLGTEVQKGKDVITVDGKEYILEKAFHADVAIVGATIADKMGNLVHRGATRNFNPLMAAAADVTIVYAEKVVEVGEIDPSTVHTPSIFVNYIVGGAE